MTADVEARCDDCGNGPASVEVGWFVVNNRTGSIRCTRCGSYNTTPEAVPRA